MHGRDAALAFVALCSQVVIVPAQQGQQGTATLPAQPAAALAISSQGAAASAPDIVVALVHVAPAGSKCEKSAAPCVVVEHWHADVTVAGKPGAPAARFAMAKRAELQKQLTAAAAPKAKTKRPVGVDVSEASLSIRADAQTPYREVEELLQAAAASGIYAIEFAVVPAPGGKEQRLPVPLPTDEGRPPVEEKPDAVPEICVALLRDPATGACIRQLGKTKIADGAAGDRDLRDKLRAAAADARRPGGDPSPVRVEVQPGVPWQAVVGVIDACKAEGLGVAFANPDTRK